MRNRNNLSKPIKHFCFKREEQYKNKSILFAGNASLSHVNQISCYSISEASNEFKTECQLDFPEHDVSMESIYEISNNRYVLLLRSLQKDQIRECTFIPNKEICQIDPSPVFQTENPNSRISFFFPLPNKTNGSFQTIYSIGNKLYKKFSSTEEINLPSKNRPLHCGTYINKDVFAFGVSSNLLLYDSRTKDSSNEGSIHVGDISTISVNRLDTNILYTGSVDGFAKQIDIRNWINSSNKVITVHEVFTGHRALPQCPVIHVAPNPVDKSIFATASSGNSSMGYIRIFKEGNVKYFSKSNDQQKSKQTQEEAFISATTQNKVTWIDWSYADPSLLVSVDMNGQFRTHYFTDFDFGGMFNDI